jgi:hypothetical protein
MNIDKPRIGQVHTLQDAATAINDIERWLGNLFTMFQSTTTTPGAGTLRVLVEEEDGTVQLWDLVAGAGVTVNKNFGTRTITITSP